MAERPQGRPDRPPVERDRSGRSELVLLNDEQYKDTLRRLIPQAKDRVWIQTMTFDGDGAFPEFQGLFNGAADRGVDTRYTVDMFHKMFVGDSLYYFPHVTQAKRKEVRESKAGRREALADMESHGVQVTVTNPPQNIKERLNPGRGRNHRKMAIIDDVAFMGDQHHFVTHSQPGTMTEVTDPILVDGLAKLYESADQGRGGDDYELVSSDGSSLLVDAGIPRRSLIMDRAKTAIEGAQSSIKMTNQHTSDGELVVGIQAAQDNGVTGTLFVGNPQLLDFPLSWMFDTRSQLLSHRQGISVPTLETPDWIHSNILLVDEGLPTAQAIMGTRCYSDTIADWASQEVAIHTTNPDYIAQVGDHLRRLEASATLRKPDRTVREIVFSRRLNQ